eukprot:9888413-Karenia_brevis.AAC.1
MSSQMNQLREAVCSMSREMNNMTREIAELRRVVENQNLIMSNAFNARLTALDATMPSHSSQREDNSEIDEMHAPDVDAVSDYDSDIDAFRGFPPENMN